MIARATAIIIALALLGVNSPALPQPALTNPASGTLQLVASGSALPRVDGLAFDAAGNLFAALEVVGSGGGVVYVNKSIGTVSGLLAAISGSDQVKLHPSGSLFVTSELKPPPVNVGGIYRVDLTYSAGVPIAANATYLTTFPALIDNPEGLVVLPASSAFGNAGDLVVSEDLANGRVIKVALGVSPAATTILVDSAVGLARPEGLVYGDFNGQGTGALYLAETLANRVLRIGSDGAYTEFGNSSDVGLTLPDNLAVGPDGFLYVAEDVTGANSGRIMRVGADGMYATFAQGFKKPAGLAFDPLTGDLYIAEQDLAKIWRVNFATPVPEPTTWVLMGAGLLLLAWAGRRQRFEHYTRHHGA